jgi:tetratricopeptide (TPR) repeat protein/predicted Ser/Thr protein kinase
MIGDTIGPYRVCGSLGRGGVGIVYRAQHVETGRVAAVKTVLLDNEAALRSIRSEIRALARLRHPGIARILDEGVDGGRPWYAMELLSGNTLREHCGPSPRPAEVFRLVRRLCAPLAFLHGEGIVHRDLKPDNVLIVDGERPVLIDFGLATQFEGRLRLVGLPADITAGTLAYVAPEVLADSVIDARADLYALGCIFYELLAGRPPFGGTDGQTVRGHLFETPPSLEERAPGLPVAVYRLIDRLLAKSPRDRIGYADDVAATLAECLASDAPAPSSKSASSAPSARAYVYRPGFTGRDDALATIVDRVGRGAFVVVRGEAGAGKTRLLVEAAIAAESKQVKVLAGECSEPRGVPLEALRKPLEAIADRLRTLGDQEVERGLGPRARVLAPYVPELAHLPGVERHPEPPRLEGRAAEARVVGSLVTTLAACAETHPVMLVIDDVHWADELTLAFLRHVARPGVLSETRLLVVLACRSEEEGAEHRALRAQPGVVDVPLGRLAESAVASIAGDMLARPVPPRFARYLARQSEGNPFFVAEYMRLAVSEGVLARDPHGSWRLPEDDAYDALELPGSLREVVSRRLEGLHGAAATLVSAAAVLGRECELALLAAVSGLEDDPFLAARDELVRRQIIDAARTGTLRFDHAKLREVAYDALGDERRVELHGRAASAIEGLCKDEASQRTWAAALAVHRHRSGQLERAAESYRLAARHALEVAATTDAIAHLGTAIRILDDLTETPELLASKVDLRTDLFLPSVHVLTAASDRNVDLCKETLALAERLGDHARLSVVHANLANCFYARASYDDCIRYGRLTMDQLVQPGAVGGSIAAVHTVVGALLQTGQVAEVVTRTLPLLAQLEQAGACRSTFGVTCPPYVGLGGALAWAYGLMGRQSDADEWIGKSVRAATEAEHRYGLAAAHVYAAGALAPLEAPGRILAHGEAALRLARENGFAGFEVFAMYAIGVGNLVDGRPKEALEWAERALGLATKFGFATVQTNGYAVLAAGHLALGDPAHTAAVCGRALAVADRTGEHKLDADLHRLFAEARMAQASPDHDDAAHHLAASLEVIARLGTVAFEPRTRIALGRLHALRGEVRRGREEIVRARDVARSLSLVPHERAAEEALRAL